MGLLDRAISALNKADDVKTDIEYGVFRDRRFDRAEKLAAEGVTTEAVVTGIDSFYNDTTEIRVRLEWFDPSPRVGAVHYGAAMPLAIRLGSTVCVATDGDKVAIDPGPMRGVPGAPQDAGRTQRKIPEQGIKDSALDASVLKRFKKWTPETATVASLEQSSAFGMATENWHITVTRADGSTALVKKDYVPPYARFYIAPGAEVPIVVDPKDPGRAQINYPMLAEQRATKGGTWKDRPPAGSIAEVMLAPPSESPVSPLMGAGNGGSVEPATDLLAPIEGVTLEQWALVEADLAKNPVKPADYDRAATDRHGIPEGRWVAIRTQWEARRGPDGKIAQAFGEAYSAAQKELKKRR